MRAPTWLAGLCLAWSLAVACSPPQGGGCPALSCPDVCAAGFRYDSQTHCRTCECWPVCTAPAPQCDSTCGLSYARDPSTGCQTCECCHPVDCVDGCHGAQDEKGCGACGPCG